MHISSPKCSLLCSDQNQHSQQPSLANQTSSTVSQLLSNNLSLQPNQRPNQTNIHVSTATMGNTAKANNHLSQANRNNSSTSKINTPKLSQEGENFVNGVKGELEEKMKRVIAEMIPHLRKFTVDKEMNAKDLKQINADQEKKVDNLQKDMKRVEGKVTDAVEETNRIRGALNQAKEAKVQLEQDVKSLKEQIEAIELQNRDLLQKTVASEEEIQVIKQEKDRLVKERESTKQNIIEALSMLREYAATDCDQGYGAEELSQGEAVIEVALEMA
ncbi:hypothetical protein BDZ85DRAFT_30026 [Elsinoe ampelina]|uniref:Uncharacterized protein n=1 Tax=Elsinoe ampelina TaxID=302913 RepID=A0A6A6G4U5_9PEZI|nr:hypothetical protein BDZ85DRAFT_30026 [Elsinoe ampelina]